MSTTELRDRYVSFTGLDCDANATRLVETLRQYCSDTTRAAKWADYFSVKLVEKERLGVDDLFFIGSQMNSMYAYIDELGDEQMHALLYQVEQECC